MVQAQNSRPLFIILAEPDPNQVRKMTSKFLYEMYSNLSLKDNFGLVFFFFSPLNVLKCPTYPFPIAER